MLIDLRILELLASKICHDLVSPVGAINNGVELIEDIGGDVTDEAMELIRNSAEQASLRLRLFRLAYGRAGSDSNLIFKEARDTLDGHFRGGKIKLHFADDFPPAALEETRGALRCLINLVILAEEALVYGGTILCQAGGAFEGGARLIVQGRNAGLSAASLAALRNETDIEDITPRSIHAHVTGQFLAMHGFCFKAEKTAEESMVLDFAPASVPGSPTSAAS